MKILLHICCGNCAIVPLQILKGEGHRLRGFWFNPNIHPLREYGARLDSVKRLAEDQRIDMQYRSGYAPDSFLTIFDSAPPPFPRRCTACYTVRLEETAREAAGEGFDAFGTTLLISPHQGFDQIARVGNECAEKYNVSFYLRDFRPHFRQSLTAARALGLYRQKYCGCLFSREERQERGKRKRKHVLREEEPLNERKGKIQK